VIVLQIEVANFAVPNVKGQPPIAADRNAPRPGPVASELVHAPAGRPHNTAHISRRNQYRKDAAQAPHKIIAEFPAVVVFDEAEQAPVPGRSE
jgi:hypothetical protein